MVEDLQAAISFMEADQPLSNHEQEAVRQIVLRGLVRVREELKPEGESIYVLTVDDILQVAEQNNLLLQSITPRVIKAVQGEVEAAFENWAGVVEDALDRALSDEEGEMTYAKALAEMESWGDDFNDFTDENHEVLAKARQALRDCLEMGMTGEGE